MKSETTLLTMKNICKYFTGVKALINVDFTLRQGEIHALMGENGAGKSTLIKVLTGVEKLDEGEIQLLGEKVQPKSTHEAQGIGISTVYQEVNLCSNLSVAENIFIGREPMKFGKIAWKEMHKRAKMALEKLDVQIDVTQTLDSYSVAIQQMVAIARAVDVDAKVLILDEPTSSLDKKEVEKLFSIMRKLKGEGIGIVFVTHFLDQVYAVCDRITVLRNGEFVGEYQTKELPKVNLVAKMIGKDYEELNAAIKGKEDKANKKDFIQDVFLEAKGLGKKTEIDPYDVTIYKGEVLGLAGLLGSGRTEMARLLFGATKPDEGEIYIEGTKKNIITPLQAIKSEIAYCPENRKADGIIPDLSVRENIILALQSKRGWMKYIKRSEQEKIADDYINLLSIKTSSAEKMVKELSGGNQQKVILARWLLTQPKLLILDEPTRGIDIGTKTEIQKLVIEFANQGMSVIFISSELDEMLRTCSRMVVLRDRVKIAELTEDELETNVIMNTIAGGN
ncbi:MAG: Monosaccharide-transporting ATPase [Clostridia bacterium]|nr:Monosaccharide-transporting ATPase [Clostridia bacterium]